MTSRSDVSAFGRHPRVWCDICGGRTLKQHTNCGVCRACIQKELERLEHDEEMRSLCGYTDEERERI